MSYERIIRRQPFTELAHIADALIAEIEHNDQRLTSIENHLAAIGYAPVSVSALSKFNAMVSRYDNILNSPDYVEHEPVRPVISYTQNGLSKLLRASLILPIFVWSMSIILLLMVAHPILNALGVFG